MQIRVSTGNCRTAVGAAILAAQASIDEWRTKAVEDTYTRLVDGAVHNNIHVSDAVKAEMKQMAERDVESMSSRHPAHGSLEVLNNFVDMLAFHHGDDIVIDDQDFNLIKKHLATS
jgi:D-hexose-6-phosphate mutarotase